MNLLFSYQLISLYFGYQVTVDPTVGLYTVTCIRGLCVTYRRLLDWMTGFIDTLFTQLETTGNYSAITNLHTLLVTVTHSLGFSVFTSRILETDL
jgi:hypothetical protein